MHHTYTMRAKSTRVRGKVVTDRVYVCVTSSREDDGTGKLKIDKGLLPFINISAEVIRRSGDTSSSEMPGLAAMHTLFLREHNKLCDALRTHPDVDSTWTDIDYYQNARRILNFECSERLASPKGRGTPLE